MKWIRSLSVNARLFIGFGLIIGLMAVVVVTAYFGITEAQTSEEALYEEVFANISDLRTLRSNLNAEQLAIAVMLETERSGWTQWQRDLKERTQADDEIVNGLFIRFRRSWKESSSLDRFIVTMDAYRETRDNQILRMIEEGKVEEAKQLFLGVQLERHLRMRRIAQQLEDGERLEAQRIVELTEQRVRSRVWFFVGLGVEVILLSVVLSILISRTISEDIAGRKKAEEALARANRALKMLNVCNSIAIHATEEIQLLDDICKSIVEMGGYKLAWVGYAEDDENKTVRPMAFAGSDGDYVTHANISWAENERGRGPTGRTIRTGKVIIARDTATESDYDPWRYRAIEKGYRSSATFPLTSGDRVYGALMVYSGIANAFDDEETRLLTELAADMAYATTALRAQSARVQAERKTFEMATYARGLLEASLDPLVTISPSGKITDVNKATEEATGKCRTELIGTDFSYYFAEPEQARKGYQEVLTKGCVRDYPLTILHSSGRRIEVLYNATVYRDDAGNVQGVFAAARDITTRKCPAEEKEIGYHEE